MAVWGTRPRAAPAPRYYRTGGEMASGRGGGGISGHFCRGIGSSPPALFFSVVSVREIVRPPTFLGTGRGLFAGAFFQGRGLGPPYPFHCCVGLKPVFSMFLWSLRLGPFWGNFLYWQSGGGFSFWDSKEKSENKGINFFWDQSFAAGAFFVHCFPCGPYLLFSGG